MVPADLDRRGNLAGPVFGPLNPALLGLEFGLLPTFPPIERSRHDRYVMRCPVGKARVEGRGIVAPSEICHAPFHFVPFPDNVVRDDRV